MEGKASFYPLSDERSMLSYTIQTSEGQSGAPILLELKNESTQWAIVGVHIGSVPQGPSKYFNLGTRITPEDLEWIDSTS
jgi:V8-like Glu-specific endopeptidase